MDLKEFFKLHSKAALAFSGGVDSSYLLYAAKQCGADVRAYYVKSAFQPQFELEDAKHLAEDVHADLKILEVDVLSDSQITANPPDRCYHCKKVIFSTIAQAAREDGFTTILDGTNASDDAGDRPGMRADQARDSPPVQRSGTVYMGQARLCLSCYPHPHRNSHHG